MKIADIDFPKPILDALRDDRLVVFAGAGVSMGEPAGLPSFSKLVEAIARGTGAVLDEGESEDQFLGRLRHRGVHVHARAAEELSRHAPQPTTLHSDLLRIFREPASTRIVTTNFDLLFERAATKLFDSRPDVFAAPALPVGSRFTGIVHVHGSVDREDEMVLTDSDFGRAYLTEGWARRFLVDLFRSDTVLFVGYSHNDTVMNYLARALPADTERFALTNESAVDRWQILGVRPVIYPQSSSGDHSSLYDGVNGLANYVSRGILDWQREITELARNAPPLEAEASDIIHDALSDPTRTRFFTSAASHTEWIGWLDRNGYLDSLFKVGFEGISEQDVQLAEWLARNFARDRADELFHLVARRNLQVHHELWFALARAVGFEKDQPLDPDDLARWVSILLQTAPPSPWMGSIRFILPALGERCANANLTASLLEIFTKMTANQLEISSLLPYMENTDVNIELTILPKVEPDSNDFDLKEFWRLRLKPRLDKVAEPLLAIVVQNLTSQHRVLGAWKSADRNWDAASYGRSAIEPHEQDRYPEATGVVIDVGRDCLEYLSSAQPAVASDWCDRLVRQDAPILRRLAVHMLSVRCDLTADEKIDWLLANIGLHDLAAHHETFQAMRAIYPHASSERRRAVVDAVVSYEWPITEDDDRERLTVGHQFSWFHWIQEADPTCELAKQFLGNLRERYPWIRPQEHPDLTVYTTEVTYEEPQSPWSVSELLSRPAREWADELLAFRRKDPLGPNRTGLLRTLEQAATEGFEWGIDLADALAESGDWDADLWTPLMRAWSRALDAYRHRQALGRLRNAKLYSRHPRSVADTLCALVKDGGLPYATELLTEANKLAAALWDGLDRSQQVQRDRDWLFLAINHPAGVVAEFWLQSLALWQKQQDTRPDSLGVEYKLALSEIVQDTTSVGRLGKAVIASRLGFILAADEDWTKQCLVPLFECEVVDDRQAVWDGFLYGPLNPRVADCMKDAFLTGVSSMVDLFPGEGDVRQQFVTFYAGMVAYFVDKPLDVWIPRFFESAESEDKRRFAWALGRDFHDMDNERQREWWERWLKRYWENRLSGIPAPLDAGEVEAMLDWLPHLNVLFHEAVELAIQMPQTPLDRNSIIHEISRGDLWEKYPEATAKLLIHVADSESPGWAWHGGKELIDRLLQLSLPNDLRAKLKEIPSRLGLSTEGA